MALPNVHPEFGYFCTAPRFRRDLRVGFYSILFGTVVGAGAIIALGAGGNRSAHDATAGRAATAGADTTAPSAKAEATPAAIVNDIATSSAGRSDASKSETVGKSDTAASDAVKNNMAKNDNDAAKNGTAKNDAAKMSCGDEFWAQRDPACLAPKPRRVRVREAPDSAAMAGVHIGRATPAEVNAPSTPAANLLPPQAMPAPVAASDNATAAPPSPPVAAPKKPQKTARSQNRRRDEVAEDFLWRDDRADGGRDYGDDSPRSRRGVTDEDSSRRGDRSARETRAARWAPRGYDDDESPRGFGRERGPVAVAPLGGLFGALFGGRF